MATVVAILVAATEALAEVVVVVDPVDVEAAVTVVRILIGVGRPVVVRPAILPVCDPLLGQ
jgi:hypothetical protein